MSDTIRIKGGNGNVPRLEDRELAYSRDEQALYIGTDEGNVRFGGVFYAIYGETTIDEVQTAYGAGKIVACVLPDDHKILYLTSIWEEGCVFAAFSWGGITSVELQGATWYEPEVISIQAPAVTE